MKLTNRFIFASFILNETIALSVYFCKESGSYGIIASDSIGTIFNWAAFRRAPGESEGELIVRMTSQAEEECKNRLLARKAELEELEKRMWAQDGRRAQSWSAEDARKFMIQKMQDEG